MEFEEKIIAASNYLEDHQRVIEGRGFAIAPRHKLAKEFGTSPTSMWRALQRLKKYGIIRSRYMSAGKSNIYEV
jgi:DNA-binding GntR family transcriptional regulator